MNRAPITGRSRTRRHLPTRSIVFRDGATDATGSLGGRKATINTSDFDSSKHRAANAPNAQRQSGGHPEKYECPCLSCRAIRVAKGEPAL